MNQICKYCADPKLVCSTKKVEYVMCENIFKFGKLCTYCENGTCTIAKDIYAVCPNVLKYKPELLAKVKLVTATPNDDNCEKCGHGRGWWCKRCINNSYVADFPQDAYVDKSVDLYFNY